jgi:hypothetical protein
VSLPGLISVLNVTGAGVSSYCNEASSPLGSCGHLTCPGQKRRHCGSSAPANTASRKVTDGAPL